MVKRLSALAAIALLACNSSPGNGRENPADSGSHDLVVAVGADEFGLVLNRGRLGRYPLNASICETLVKMTKDFRVVPWLARRWDYLGNNTYRFTLRRDVRFHDGHLLSASDVKYTLDRGIADKTQYSFLSDSSVRVVDDSTVDIKPSIPNLRLLDQLVHPSYGIIANGSNPQTHPDCTGPFSFVEYVAKDHLTVSRNDNYWGAKAKLNRITFRFMADDNTRALALRAREVDAIFDVNRGSVAELEATPGISVVMSPPGAVILLYVATHGVSPNVRMTDPIVRRAVALAIDQSSLVNRVMGGYAAVVNTVNPPAALGTYFSVVHGISYNPREANRLLDAAGWKTVKAGMRSKYGTPLSLSMIVQPNSVDKSITQYIQAQLAKVGIGVEIEDLDGAAYESRLNSGRFDLDVEIPNQNDANPAFLLALRWYSKSNVRSAPFMLAGLRFDSLVSTSLASADRDSAQRKAAEAMHVLIDDEVAAIPLAGIYRIYAMSNRIRGFDPHPSRINQAWNTVSMSR